MSTMWLGKWSDNWADEMNLDGFVVYTEEQKAAWLAATNHIAGYTYYVGTNEEIEYDSPGDLRRSVIWTELTEAEAAVLTKLFNGYRSVRFGFFPDPRGY